jgi:hypothetical protein
MMAAMKRAAAPEPVGGHGDVIVKANIVGTMVFAITAALAAAVFDNTTRWIAAITVMVLFAIGVFAFLWGYYNAVQRSRADEIGVAQLYLLTGDVAPKSLRRTMNLTLLTQVVVALVTALSRPRGPGGGEGSSLALGVLVPMFGLAMNGLWAAYHGRFPPRSPTSGRGIGQNADHG